MTDDNTTTPDDEVNSLPETPPATGDDQLGPGGLKALETERQARRDAERQLREAQATIAGLETAALRRDVAASHGLPTALADRLRGETREELEADAASLASVAPGAKPPPSQKPKPDLRGGGDPTSPVEASDATTAERILRRDI